ncbi:MAG: hypothetical protein IKD15_00900 [Clostridia bacterium]|nr:hypothetical protein [Clostridia bacterium]
MKKIGIIDYFIDEWHSNTYLGLFEKASQALGVEYKVVYGYAEVEQDGKMHTDDWCAKNNVIRCNTIEELCEKSDNILILAPANPETHLRYAEAALKYGKTTYIDKTFAPDLETAKAIFAVAEKYNTKIFTSSALRYAEEIADYTDVKNVMIKGGGRSLEEYIIHQIEMAVKLTKGEQAKLAHVFSGDRQSTIVLEYAGRTVTLSYSNSGWGFSVDVETDKANCEYKNVEKGTEFYRLVESIVKFFETNEEPFDKKETLAVLAIRDAIMKGISNGEKTIPVENY